MKGTILYVGNFELPDNVSLSDAFKTIGNGVPFLLAKGLAESIYDYLSEC